MSDLYSAADVFRQGTQEIIDAIKNLTPTPTPTTEPTVTPEPTGTQTSTPEPPCKEFSDIDEAVKWIYENPIPVIDVEAVDQHWTTYQDEKYSLTNNQNHACGPTALYMVLNYLNGENYSEDSFNAFVKESIDEGYYLPEDEENKEYTSPGDLDSLAGFMNNGNYRSQNIQDMLHGINTLRCQLIEGHPVIVDVTQPIGQSGENSKAHFVLVTGIKSDGIQITIYYNNPFTGKNEDTDYDTFYISWYGNIDTGGSGYIGYFE